MIDDPGGSELPLYPFVSSSKYTREELEIEINLARRNERERCLQWFRHLIGPLVASLQNQGFQAMKELEDKVESGERVE